MRDLFRRLLTPLWLRPERALVDAHQLHAVRHILGDRLERPALEYGCTEGVNTFLMFDGEFDLAYDDYQDLIDAPDRITDPAGRGDQDYFSSYRSNLAAAVKTPATETFDVGVSWRKAHLEKAARLSIYNELVLIELNQRFEALQGRTFATIWSPNLFWTRPDELSNLLLQHRSILAPQGRIVTILPDDAQVRSELWSRLPKLPDPWLEMMDRGIRENLTKNAKSDSEWRATFAACGLEASRREGFLTQLVGDIYQIGLRPMFPVFMEMYSALRKGPAEDFLDLKKHWIETVENFLGPLCEPALQPGGAGAHLWHVYELRHAR